MAKPEADRPEGLARKRLMGKFIKQEGAFWKIVTSSVTTFPAEEVVAWLNERAGEVLGQEERQSYERAAGQAASLNTSETKADLVSVLTKEVRLAEKKWFEIVEPLKGVSINKKQLELQEQMRGEAMVIESVLKRVFGSDEEMKQYCVGVIDRMKEDLMTSDRTMIGPVEQVAIRYLWEMIPKYKVPPIDEKKRQEEARQILNSEWFARIKEKAIEIREGRNSEGSPQKSHLFGRREKNRLAGIETVLKLRTIDVFDSRDKVNREKMIDLLDQLVQKVTAQAGGGGGEKAVFGEIKIDEKKRIEQGAEILEKVARLMRAGRGAD